MNKLKNHHQQSAVKGQKKKKKKTEEEEMHQGIVTSLDIAIYDYLVFLCIFFEFSKSGYLKGNLLIIKMAVAKRQQENNKMTV